LAQVQQSVGGQNLSRRYPYNVDGPSPNAQFVQEFPEEGRQIGLYDAVIGNADRHMGNIVQGDDGAIYPIDHGGAFTEGNNWQPYGPGGRLSREQLRPEEIAALKKARRIDVRKMGVSHEEHMLKNARIDQMLANGRFI
jgi:hypothetical protein